ncbi:ATP-binding cassette domain-containing protein [Iocasia frigidifontis]|uniref:ATP-binding cassette domain-containing protein n=1 Tax=Iocasia fonsfrigidae TaxID=2682810 RepID=A0A8A7K7D6_9FIRM|nr:ATP-binding cassette domain-containing protein [Iocasia fonsfrigidae]QTL97636.1 ATP-binding cassette domain-containing protein [Iocasia fonsfrigidae]
MNQIIFEIKGLSGTNQDGYSLKKIDFDLVKGEVHALVGEKGMGKKAFYELLLGSGDYEQGQIYIKNKNITLHLNEVKNNKISYLSDDVGLIDNFTVAENLFLLNYPSKKYSPSIDWKKINRMAKQLFDELNVKIDYNKKVYELSNEEQKIVAIAKLYLIKPEVIIMHEPTDNLGAKSIILLYKIINKMKKRGASIIYVTNEWEEALKIADRISVLSRGIIVGTMESSEAKANPRKLLNLISGWNRMESKNEDVDHYSLEVLNVVFKAAEFLTSNYELEDVLKFLVNHITKVMNSDNCIIYLIDEETDSVIDYVDYNKSKDIDAKLKRNVVIDIIKENESYYTTDNDREFKAYFTNLKNIKTIICVPVLIRSHITGLIQISYRDYYAHSEKEIMYLSTFARQVAIAIEDTRLMGNSALLQESHHRIKNNLQTIISLIKLQKKFTKKDSSKTIDDIINDIISRIKSIAAVHDLLSREKQGRSIINFKEIIKIITKFYNNNEKVNIKLILDDIFIPYNKATAIALIINELINNCYKHAFKNQNKGIVRVSCKNQNNNIVLLVSDNGHGLPESFDIDNLNSLGISIVQSIILNEFEGQIDFKNNKGTVVEIILPEDKLALTKWE